MSAVSVSCRFPPTDLGQVEVIKGVASALYGAGALGGVVDLISRRPTTDSARDALLNRTSRGGTDAVLFAAQPLSDHWSATLLTGGHWQQRSDLDEDGWADLAGYSRGVVRPRLFWSDDSGRSCRRSRRRASDTLGSADSSAAGGGRPVDSRCMGAARWSRDQWWHSLRVLGLQTWGPKASPRLTRRRSGTAKRLHGLINEDSRKTEHE